MLKASRCAVFFALLGGLLVVVGAHGADEAPASRLPAVAGPVRLTPATAAAMVIARAPDSALADQNIAAAQGKLQQAQAMNGWQLSALASHTRQGPVAAFDLSGMGLGRIVMSPSNVTTGAISATKPLYLGSRDRYSCEAAAAGVDAARVGRAAVDLGLAQQGRQAVYALLRLQQLWVVTQQRTTAVAEHLRLAESMFAAGTVARFEVVQAQTELERARGDEIAARTAVAQQKAALCELLNLPQGTALEAEEGVPLATPEGDLHKLIQVAFDQRPDLRAADYAVRAAEASLRLAEANDRPTLAASGQWSYTYQGSYSDSDAWKAGLTLTKPIFQGGQTKALITQAKAGLETARLDVERGQQQIALQVSQASLALDDAREQVVVAERGVDEARERQRIAEVRFQSGVSLGVEVLDAQTALAAAEAQLVNARFGLQSAMTALRAAMGFLDVAKE